MKNYLTIFNTENGIYRKICTFSDVPKVDEILEAEFKLFNENFPEFNTVPTIVNWLEIQV